MRQMGRIIDLGGRKISDLGVQEFYKLIHQVFIDGLICVKNQHLDLDKDFLSVICKLGNTKHITNILRREQDEPNFPQLFRIGNLRVDGTVKKGHKFAEYWHQDGDFWGYPDNFIVQWLLSKYTPKIGGETAFIDGIAALELIETELRDKLLEAEFEFRVNDIEDFKDVKTQDHGFPEKIKHKTVYKHKILNKNYLYIGYESNVIQFKDGSTMGVTKLMDILLSYPQILYTHKYEEGDLLIWDNVSTIHKGMGGYFESPRLLYRGQSFISSYHEQLLQSIIQ